ncbi:MAG: MFS transporter [Nitrososphaerales archaeon]
MSSDPIKSLIASSAAHFVNDGALAFFPLLYPILANDYSISTLSISVLASLLYAVSIFVSPLMGKKLDSTRRHGDLLALGILLLSIGILAYSLFPLLLRGFTLVYLLIPFTIVAGFGSALYHPLASTVLRETWGQKKHGHALGVNGAAGSLGRALYPLIATFILASSGLPTLAVLGIASVLISVFVLGVFKKTTISGASLDPVESEKGSRSSSWSLASTVRTLMVVAFSKGLIAQGLISFLPYYLTNIDHFSLAYTGLVFSLALGSGVVFQPAMGYLADRYGRALILEISNVGCVVSLTLFLLTNNPILVGIYLFGFGSLGLTGFPLLLGLSAHISPRNMSTEAASLVWGVAYTSGIAISPLVIAILAEPNLLNSFQSSFFVIVALGLLSVVLTPFIHKPKVHDLK